MNENMIDLAAEIEDELTLLDELAASLKAAVRDMALDTAHDDGISDPLLREKIRGLIANAHRNRSRDGFALSFRSIRGILKQPESKLNVSLYKEAIENLCLFADAGRGKNQGSLQ